MADEQLLDCRGERGNIALERRNKALEGPFARSERPSTEAR